MNKTEKRETCGLRVYKDTLKLIRILAAQEDMTRLAFVEFIVEKYKEEKGKYA